MGFSFFKNNLTHLISRWRIIPQQIKYFLYSHRCLVKGQDWNPDMPMPDSGLLPPLSLVGCSGKDRSEEDGCHGVQWRQRRSTNQMDEKKDLPVRAIIHSSELLTIFFGKLINKYYCSSLGIFFAISWLGCIQI